jgi:hypothetical protein
LGELVWLDQGNAERLDLVRGILKELKHSVKRLTDFGDTSFEWKLFRVIIRSYEKNIEKVSLFNEKSNKPFDVLFQIVSALRLILETFRDSK